MMKTIGNKTISGLLFWVLLVFCNSPLFAELSANSYYPLALDNCWMYENTLYPHTERVMGIQIINEVLYYGLSLWSSDVVDYWIRNEGSITYIFNVDDSTEFILYNFNADIGESWELPDQHWFDLAPETHREREMVTGCETRR